MTQPTNDEIRRQLGPTGKERCPMNADRELLELAAKAIGGEYRDHRLGGQYLAYPPNWNGTDWDPKNDSYDSLRLATALYLTFETREDAGGVFVWRIHGGVDVREWALASECDGKMDAAARLAILRAAARIGKGIK